LGLDRGSGCTENETDFFFNIKIKFSDSDREIEALTQEIEDVQEHYQVRLRRERELERMVVDHASTH
jgi:hypothetical protein